MMNPELSNSRVSVFGQQRLLIAVGWLYRLMPYWITKEDPDGFYMPLCTNGPFCFSCVRKQGG